MKKTCVSFLILLFVVVLMSCSQDETILSETLVKFELVHGVELSEPTVYIPRVKEITNGIA